MTLWLEYNPFIFYPSWIYTFTCEERRRRKELIPDKYSICAFALTMHKKKFYAKLILKEEISEGRPDFSFFRQKEQTDLGGIVRMIEAARKEKRVQALVLVLKRLAIDWAQIEELHSELDRFHQAGKRTLAYVENADNKSYYLACGTQQVYLPPSGHLELVGLRAEIFFFKNLLDYLGIEPELFSLGEYKSAAEIFTREGMSEASRQMTDSILSDLQNRLKEKVAAARSVEASQVQEWIDHGPYTAHQALEKGLIDGLHYEDELEELLKNGNSGLTELPASKLRDGEGLLSRIFTSYRPQIAYIVAEGVITSGESRRGRGRHPLLGSDTLVSFLRHVRKRKKIKAVVLRINSPGGSALASDLIWREIRLTDKQKPVIVSFGNLAASGGYYMATAARKIITLPSTLTGSIGVIGGKFNLRKLLLKLGIGVDSLEKGEHSGYLSPARPFSKEEAEVVQTQIRAFYEELFLKKVAQGRNKSIDEVRKVAQGRVWTGTQAVELGLLDQVGGVSEAVEMARQEARIVKGKRVRIVYYLKRRRLRDLFSLPALETLSLERILALMPEEWTIR